MKLKEVFIKRGIARAGQKTFGAGVPSLSSKKRFQPPNVWRRGRGLTRAYGVKRDQKCLDFRLGSGGMDH